jgi:cadmium resistance protein CadD (predicted permease)
VISSWFAIISASITTFAATNVDDILLLTLLSERQVPTRRIVAGQYLGFAIIILLSVLGALAALSIPRHWFRLLGLLPLATGIKQLVTIDRRAAVAQSETGVLSIALVTLSNGSDNIGIYVPFFAIGRAHLPVILLVYTALIAILCLVGRWLGRHPLVLTALRGTSHWLVPVMFMILGIYIVLTS